MAEGGVIEQEQEHSVAIGSEFVYDFYCELCRDDGLNVEAEGFCVNCEEYLCKPCMHVHKKSRPTRHHDLLDQDAMPKDTPLSHDRINKDISTTCKFHSKETVKYYCASHDTLGCSSCFVTGHRTCPNIESIYDKSENILNSLEYKDFAKRLKDMERKSRGMILKTRDNVTTTELNCSVALDQIRNLREEFMTCFDELEQDLVTELESLTSETKEKMEHTEKELLTFSKEVDQLKAEVEALATSKRVCQLFIQIKTQKSALSTLEGNIRQIERENEVRMFVFEPNTEIRNVLTATGLGKIVVQDRQSREAGPVVADDSQDISDIKAEHVSDINISPDSDSGTHYILGCAVLSDTKVVIADHSHNKVILLDVCTNTRISEVKLESYPFDIAVVNEKQIAVSLFDLNKIIILNVTDTLQIDRTLVVQGKCRGVAYSQNKLFVLYDYKPRLDVMDMQGNVINIIDKQADGSKLFSHPRHICVNNSGETVYVSDAGTNKLVCLTLDGVVKAVYTGPKDPQKVCIDHRGYIYVAGSESKTVHMLTADCTKIKEILTHADGLDSRVLSVMHCPRTDRLYVGMAQANMIKVYQLKSA